MSARKWKPGDVAMVRRGGKEVVAMRYHTGSEGGWRWQQAAGLAFDHFDADEDTTPRPLVVLDPEDREQVERLALLIRDAESGDWIDDTQAALREFANPAPPKPAEPTGLGAVVEDAEGVRYVLTHGNSGQPVWVDRFSEWEYAKIAAVRVLSEGWSE